MGVHVLFCSLQIALSLIFDSINTTATSSTAIIPSQHCLPRRPKGSRNKVKNLSVETDGPSVPRPLGRPCGTGPKQLVRAQGLVEPELPKRPVGHLRKMPPPQAVSVR